MWGIDDEIQRMEYRYYCVECNAVQTDCSTEKGFDYAQRIGYPQKMNMPLIADCVPNNLAPLQTFSDQPMMIDYMKYYKRVDCNESVYVTEFNSSRHENPSPRAYAGERVYISGYNSANSSFNHIVVPNGENLNIGATDIIDIQNDFEAEEGSFFEAHAKPCSTLIDVVAAKKDETTQLKKTKNVFSTNIYPNPTASNFNIAINNLLPDGIEIEILNYLSGTVYRNYFAENAVNSLLKISDLNLPSGIYLVKISNGSNKSLQRLVITN